MDGEGRIRLGISACLLGQKVCYDGSHKLDRFITETMGQYVEFVPICPDTEYGRRVPREMLRLVGAPEAPRLMTIQSGIDHTEGMRRWARARTKQLAQERLCGFIFMSKSPTCGLDKVKIYGQDNRIGTAGIGLFAHEFLREFPNLPVEDYRRLHDLRQRENFIERLVVYRRWLKSLAEERSLGRLQAFHTAHKLLLMSHGVKKYRELGHLVASARDLPLNDLYDEYERRLMEAFRQRTTTKKNANVMQHILGYFKRDLGADEKQKLQEVIDRYRLEEVPLIVPITVFGHYAQKYRKAYLEEQFYLSPEPLELNLLNHA